MSFYTHNQIRISIEGTGYVGEIDASYDELNAAFGAPFGPSGDGKVRAEWTLKFDDGTVATIYDYKHHLPVEQVRDWHVGGHVARALGKVKSAIETHRIAAQFAAS